MTSIHHNILKFQKFDSCCPAQVYEHNSNNPHTRTNIEAFPSNDELGHYNYFHVIVILTIFYQFQAMNIANRVKQLSAIIFKPN